MKSRRPALLGALGFSALLVLPGTVGADWLVTREGARMEIQGHWQVKGKLVVFTRTDGSLASLRLSEVDLEASERATAAAMEAAVAAETEEATRQTAPEPEKKKSKFVLTDADFRKAPPPPATQEEGGEAQTVTPEGQDVGEAGSQEKVVVGSWRQAARTEGDGLDVFGVLQNTGNELATDVAVTVELFAETGEQVGTSQAVLSAPGIRPNASITFRAAFPNVFTFSEARFNVRSRSLTLAPLPAEGEERETQAQP
ncbi:MAG TPA: FxLYD domain-containing protein [Thermoanaerobaculia bacterium]|nr:FxLYD domain-containing protein [Thermoanaerobaculia bacterium]